MKTCQRYESTINDSNVEFCFVFSRLVINEFKRWRMFLLAWGYMNSKHLTTLAAGIRLENFGFGTSNPTYNNRSAMGTCLCVHEVWQCHHNEWLVLFAARGTAVIYVIRRCLLLTNNGVLPSHAQTLLVGKARLLSFYETKKVCLPRAILSTSKGSILSQDRDSIWNRVKCICKYIKLMKLLQLDKVLIHSTLLQQKSK